MFRLAEAGYRRRDPPCSGEHPRWQTGVRLLCSEEVAPPQVSETWAGGGSTRARRPMAGSEAQAPCQELGVTRVRVPPRPQKEVTMSPLMRDFLARNPELAGDCLDESPAVARLLEFICPRGVVVGGVYKHFKGDRYKVLGFVRSSNDWREFRVRYVQVDDADHEATRLVSEFLEDVTRGDYSGPRFTLVGVP